MVRRVLLGCLLITPPSMGGAQTSSRSPLAITPLLHSSGGRVRQRAPAESGLHLSLRPELRCRARAEPGQREEPRRLPRRARQGHRVSPGCLVPASALIGIVDDTGCYRAHDLSTLGGCNIFCHENMKPRRRPLGTFSYGLLRDLRDLRGCVLLNSV